MNISGDFNNNISLSFALLTQGKNVLWKAGYPTSAPTLFIRATEKPPRNHNPHWKYTGSDSESNQKINKEIFTLEKDETAFHYLLHQYCLGEISSLHQLPDETGHFKRLLLVPCKASCEALTRQQCGPQIKRGIYLAVLYHLPFTSRKPALSAMAVPQIDTGFLPLLTLFSLCGLI